MKQILFAAGALFVCALPAASQTMSYGPNVNLETAKKIAAPATYYYINPSKCSQTTDPKRVGQIAVSP